MSVNVFEPQRDAAICCQVKVHRLKRLPQRRPLKALPGVDIEQGAVRSAHNPAAVGVEIGVSSPGQ